MIDSRDVNDGIRRRRQCLSCQRRFTTYERLQPGGIFVVKKDRRREEFNKEKLLSGIRKACEKRPLESGAIDKLADDIEAELFTLGKAGKQEHLLNTGDIPVVQVDRGGQVTYHAPGQLIAYLLLDINRLGVGVRELVTRLENTLIDTLSEYGISAASRRDAPGV